jgi:hypothetical protein
LGFARICPLDGQEAAELRPAQVVGERPPARVTGERLLLLEAAVPELRLALGPEPPAEADAEGAVLAGPVVADQLRYEVARRDDQAQVEVLVEDVRPGEQEVAIAGQGAVAPQGSFDTALDVRPALRVHQGVGGFDAGGDLGEGDIDRRAEQQQNERGGHDPGMPRSVALPRQFIRRTLGESVGPPFHPRR